MKKQFLVKGKDWEYEQEERVIDFIRKSGIHKYNRNVILKSVVAGIKINPRNFDILSQICNKLRDEGLKVDLYKATRVKGEYGLYVKERPDLNNKYPNQSLNTDSLKLAD